MELVIEESIDINAPAEKVWAVLVGPDTANQWASQFSGEGEPGISVESSWKMNSTVFWRGDDGKVMVEGKVIRLEPGKLLHFSTIDVASGPAPALDDTDGITFKLEGRNGRTRLSIRQGDFGKEKEGRKYYDMTLPAWDRILPKIKELAEK